MRFPASWERPGSSRLSSSEWETSVPPSCNTAVSRKEGFEIIAAFDQYPDRAEKRSPELGVDVHDVAIMGEYLRRHEVKMAILSVPGESAQQVANVMVESGVQAILNFSPTVLQVPNEVVVNHVDLAVELESLSYFVR